MAQIATVAMLALVVGGTFSAWTQGSDNSTNLIESAETYPPPVMDAPPEVPTSGPVEDGDELSSTRGSWSGVGGEFTYEWQWQRCDAAGANCADIPGATGETYVVTPDDVQPGGRTIRVCVTATNMYGSTTACSDPSDVIQARPAANVTPPSISGRPHEGETLTAGGEWDGTPPLDYSYQWRRCDVSGNACVDLDGATQDTYAVGRDDGGGTLRVRITVDNSDLPGGESVTDTSEPTGVVTAVSATPESVYATNGTVSTITRSGGMTYIGGTFSLAGKPTGSLAEIDLTNDQDVDMDLPPVTGGDIRAVEPDGAGGWFIGGSFTEVGGLARSYAAHILANGAVDASWNANVSSVVADLSLAGSTLYLGGYFSSVGGQVRNRAAGVSAATGAVTAFNPNAGSSTNVVFSILANGSTVYLGGAFTTVGGVARSNFAEVTADTGALTGFNPAPNEVVYTMEKVGNIIILGGGFTQVMGTSRLRAAAIDVSTNTLHPWNPSFDQLIFDIVLSGPTIYVAGSFSTVNGASHPALVGVDVTGNVTWNPPNPSGNFGGTGSPTAWTLEVVGSTIYAGGDFIEVGGEPRRGLAAFDTTSAVLYPWAPQSSTAIYASGVAGGNFYAGGGDVSGNVMLMNTLARANAAAFDSNGVITGWAPNPSGTVRALVELDDSIYLGGNFTAVGGQSRSRLAAVDPVTGAPSTWNPSANAAVNALAKHGSTIYAGGDFTAAGGQSRSHLAAFTSDSSTATSWNPGVNSTVNVIAAHDSTIYAGGAFTTAGGQARNRLAAFPAGTSAVTAWNPNVNSTVYGLYVSPSNTIYAGGSFTTAGGQARSRLAAFTVSTGAVTGWNPNASGPIWTIGGVGNNIWVGGLFATVGGQSRANVAGLRASNGTATGWNPGADAGVHSIVVDGSGIHIGGAFDLVASQGASAYAHFK